MANLGSSRASYITGSKTSNCSVVPLDERRLHADFPERFIQHDVIRWETDKRALVAQRESCFDRIVLDVRPAGRIDPVQAANVLTGAARTLGLIRSRGQNTYASGRHAL